MSKFIKIYPDEPFLGLDGYGIPEEPYDRYHAWIYLRMKAKEPWRHACSGTRIVTLDQGEIICKVAALAQVWRWSPYQVRAFLKFLEKAGLIVMTTAATKDGTRFIVTPDREWGKGRKNSHPPTDELTSCDPLSFAL